MRKAHAVFACCFLFLCSCTVAQGKYSVIAMEGVNISSLAAARAGGQASGKKMIMWVSELSLAAAINRALGQVPGAMALADVEVIYERGFSKAGFCVVGTVLMGSRRRAQRPKEGSYLIAYYDRGAREMVVVPTNRRRFHSVKRRVRASSGNLSAIIKGMNR